MNISKEKCVGCANCIPVCSVGAIYIGDDGLAEINTESCVECHNCYRSLSVEHLQPGLTRAIRRVLSVRKHPVALPVSGPCRPTNVSAWGSA